MSDDMLDCEKTSDNMILTSHGCKTVQELVDLHLGVINRLRLILFMVAIEESPRMAQQIARKELGLFNEI